MSEQLLLKNIARFVSLSKEEEAYLVSGLKIKKLRKRQYFLQAGDVCKWQGFVYKGSNFVLLTSYFI